MLKWLLKVQLPIGGRFGCHREKALEPGTASHTRITYRRRPHPSDFPAPGDVSRAQADNFYK
jgi:hypothetical protein